MAEGAIADHLPTRKILIRRSDLKIGYLYNLQVFPPKGGNHVHALELTQGFLKAGHSVFVLDDPTAPGVHNFSSSDEVAIQDFINEIDVLYVRIDARYLSLWPEALLCMSLIGDKPLVWEINSPANETLAYSWLGGRQHGVNESAFKRCKRWIHATRKRFGILREEQLRKRLSANVDTAICVSSALERYAKSQLGIRKIIVLPNGGPMISESEIMERRSKRTDHRFTVFYSGSAIYPWQGLDLMTAAIELARAKAPDMKFVLAVNQKTESLPVAPNLEIKEGLSREGILDAVCASDACLALHPDYPWSPFGFHNSPMKLFEYMACMTPVVTSNRAQMAELIDHEQNGLLCSDQAEDILEKLAFLRDSPVQAADIARSGWLCIQNGMSWQDNVRKTLRVFEELVA